MKSVGGSRAAVAAAGGRVVRVEQVFGGAGL